MSNFISPRRVKALFLSTSTLAVLTFAAPAMAQDNDVDAYDGTIPVGCATAALQATADNGRVGNIMAGTENCIRQNSSHNIVSGRNNHVEPDALYNFVLGHDNRVDRVFGSYNFVHGHDILVRERYSNLSGHTMNIQGWGNTAHGNNITIAGRAEWNAVFGVGHELQRGGDYNFVSGLNNTLLGGTNPLAFYNMVGGTNQTVEGDGNLIVGGGNFVDGDYNLIGGAGNDLGSANHSSWNIIGGFNNDISQMSTSLIVGTENTAVGSSSAANVIFGNLNNTSHRNFATLVGGRENSLGQNNWYNIISGHQNTTGSFLDHSLIMGEGNVITGGTAFDDFMNVMVLGSMNTVNGAGQASSFNFLGSNNAVVEGAGNFVGGGNDVLGPTVTGNNNVVIGTGASSVVDDSVAIGSGATATLDAAASAAAWNGRTIGAVTFTEGTDAAAEMNVGNRLVTGVADGRVASGSSDAVNGHQLFEVASAAAATSDCGDGTGTDSHICGDGSSASGNQASAFGDSASANFDGSVAVGFGSTTTMDVIAAQSAYTGLAMTNFNLTEGTDATGGEMNVGNRLVTGVADGRIASGSSDAVNGHQLFEVASQVDANHTAIDALGNEMDDVQADVSDMQTDITGLQGDVSAIQGNISDIQGDVTTIHGDISGLQSDVSDNTDAISANRLDINSNSSDIAANRMDIDTNSSNIAANRMDIDSNRSDIQTNASNIDANTVAITANTSSINANSTAIAGLSTGVNDLSARVTSTEQTNARQGQDISANTNAIAANSAVNDQQDEAIATNTATNRRQSTEIEANSDVIALNSVATEQNAMAILTNSNVIAENRDLIDRNYALGLFNQKSIMDLEDGLAAVAALPDMYLSPKAKWAASGGLGLYGGTVGVGATLAIRGNDNWAMGASVGMGGSKASGKLQIRYEGF